MRWRRSVGVLTFVAVLALASSGTASAAGRLTLLGAQAKTRTVSLHLIGDNSLRGNLVLAVRAQTGGKLRVAYYRTGDTAGKRAGSVAFAGDPAPTVKAGKVLSVTLAFTLP